MYYIDIDQTSKTAAAQVDAAIDGLDRGGGEVSMLERRLEFFTGAKRCYCAKSGTSALITALRAAGVSPGDSVMCTAFSYFATAEVIALLGARPMFVDINPASFCMDPYCLEYALGRCLRTRAHMPAAVIASNIFGTPCEFGAIEEICERYGTILIEDMSQSLGAKYNGRQSGTFGQYSVASFYSARVLGGIGDGGAVLCNDESFIEAYSQPNRGWRRDDADGLEGLHAGVIAAGLDALADNVELRSKIAATYAARLSGHVKLQAQPKDGISAHTHYVIALRDSDEREFVAEYLEENNIPSHIYEPSPIKSSFLYGDWNRVALVNTSVIAGKLLALPMHHDLGDATVNYICDKVIEALD